MSFDVYMQVVESDLSPSTSRVAEVYALFANEQNNYAGSCSADWLARRTKQSESTVRVAIRELRTIGFLETLGVDPKYQTKIYRVHPEVLVARPPYVAPETYGRPKKGGVTEIPPFDDNEKGGVTDQQVLQKGGVTVTPKKEAESPEKKEAEGDNYVISTELEKLSSDTQPESVSPVMVSGSDVVKVNSAGALHNVAPDVNTIFTEILPVEPVKEKAKPKKAAKAVKPPKAPKPPRELNDKELAFLAKIEQLNPLIAPDVKQRLNEYSRGIPWSVAQVFLLTSHMPKPNNWNAIVSLNGVAFDEERMMECYNEWTLRGYSEYGLAWLTQWYKAGGPPQYVKYGKQAAQPAPAPSKAEIEFDSELVVDVTQWIKAMPGYGSKSPRSIQLGIWAAANGREQTHLGNAEELLAKYLSEKGQDHATQTTA